MPTMNELKLTALVDQLILKCRHLLVFAGDMDAEEVTTILDGTGGFVDLAPMGYKPLGHILKDSGVTFPRDVESSDVEVHGSTSPARTDVESDASQVKFTAAETNRQTLEWAGGLDLSRAKINPTTGEVVVVRPTIPDELERRVVVLGYDPKRQICMGKFMPRVNPTDFPEVAWKMSDAITYEITGKVLDDNTLGYAVKDIPVAGPGALKLLDKLGFELGTPLAWSASTAYSEGARVTLAGGQVLVASNSGTSGATAPTAPATGQTVTDGTVVWGLAA